MKFYKACDCGFKNIFEDVSFIPRKCDDCGRSLEGRPIKELDETHEIEETDLEEPVDAEICSEIGLFYIQEVLTKKSEDIPIQGGVIGRANIGWEIFKTYPSVSRAHLEVSYYKDIGLRIKDISSFGTFLNNERMIKNSEETVFEGDILRLFDCEVEIKRK